MGIIETITAPLVLALCGAVGKLWHQNNQLGKRIDGLQRSLGQMEGMSQAVMACPVKACPMRGRFAEFHRENDD